MSDQQDSDATGGPEELRGVIVIGASSGGLEALLRLVPELSKGIPAAILVTMHIPSNVPSILPELLTQRGQLPTVSARDGDRLVSGKIYVAPPDRHLLVEENHLCLSAGPRENHARPAIDPLFRSASIAYGANVIGLILSGALNDGTAGLWEIKQRDGIAIVQDPGDALYPSMPHSAMDQVPVDYVVPIAEMPGLLARLVSELPKRQKGAVVVSPEEQPGSAEVQRDFAAQVAGERDGFPAVYVCPDCGGTLWQVNAGRFTRFRCHVGHVYSAEDLLAGYDAVLEQVYWQLVRNLRDRSNLLRQMEKEALERGDTELATQYAVRAQRDAERAAAESTVSDNGFSGDTDSSA